MAKMSEKYLGHASLPVPFVVEQWFSHLGVHQNDPQSLLNVYHWTLIQSFSSVDLVLGPGMCISNMFPDASAGPGSQNQCPIE